VIPAAFEHGVAVERSGQLLEVPVRIERSADRADEGDPLLQRQLLAVLAVELLP